MPIPPADWGAAEVIVDEISTVLSATRPVEVLNSDSVRLWFRAFREHHEVIHVHRDSYPRKVARWRLLANRSTSIIFWCHYPRLETAGEWEPFFHSHWMGIERTLKRDDVFIALNPKIADVVSPRVQARVLTLPNGSDLDPSFDESPTHDVLIVGRVTARKRQYEFSELATQGIDITCVGPIEDDRVQDLLIGDPDSVRARCFVGAWTRQRLTDELAIHRVLLLPSEAEADALVLYEGQLAGLSIVCSRPALGSQDEGLAWIHVFERDAGIEEVAELCRRAVAENAIHRREIAAYARANFRWSDRIARLDGFLNGGIS